MTEEQAKTRVDPELKKKMDRHPDSMAKILREGAKMYMGNGNKKQLKDDLHDANEKFKRASKEYERWQKKKEENLGEVHRLARDLHEFKDPEEAYEEWLEEVLDYYQDGETGRLITDVIRNLDGFNKWSKTPNEVQEDLKGLAIEQERKLSESDFTGRGRGSTTPLYIEYKIDDDGSRVKREESGRSKQATGLKSVE